MTAARRKPAATDSTPAGSAFDAATASRIAAAYSPAHWHGNRWYHYYARIKLASDPLYPGVVAALRGCDAPLLDLGCGPGLLAHALRHDRLAMPYRGIDNDAGKIDIARQAARRAQLHNVQFEVVDLSAELPRHEGSVAILDVLQYLSDDAQNRTLDNAIAMLVPGARLVIRTGLDDGGGRARISLRFDQIAHRFGWMNSAPRHYPQADALQTRLRSAGLDAEFTPMSGRTPFNNWLVVAIR